MMESNGMGSGLEAGDDHAAREPGKTSDTGLLRVMRGWDLTAVGVNQVIGSGIFVLPATVAALVGAAASPLVWVVAGVVNGLIILCFAEAGTRFRDAGGPYLYAEAAFGRFVGFEVAWMLWLTRLASQAALANAVAQYVGFFWDGAMLEPGRSAIVTATILGLAAINYAGVRYGSWTINVFTVGKLVPLALFAAAGIAWIDPQRFAGIADPELAGFGQAVLLLMFAFGGYELITLPAGEATRPQRDVPRALLGTLAIVLVVFLVVQVVAVGTLPGLAGSDTPLADAAAIFLGPLGGMLIALGGLIAIFGSNAGSMLAAPRITFALAEKRQLPALFGHVHARFRTPDASIVIYAVVALALALSGTFESMAAISAVARLVFYVATCAAVPVLRRQFGDVPGAFKLPGGATVPALALLASLAILAGADSVSLLSGGVALIVGALLYAAAGRRREGGVGSG